MTTDPTPSSPDPTLPEETKNFAESGENGTFGDIDPNYQLSSPQCRAIELALSGARWSQIAKTLDLNRKTLWRWKTHDDAFQQALAAARADRRDFAVERCQTLANRASSVLADFLQDPQDKNRMRAAQLLLQAAARFVPPSPKPEPLGATASFHWLDQVLKPIGR
jgi:broad specificity phosphatase PhoE